MSSGNEHVFDFSFDGRLYASINNLGILSIWDTDSNELKQEYTPNLHLNGPCTALLWVTSTYKKKDNKAQPSSNEHVQQYVALGTSKGGVSLYSYAAASIECNLGGEGHANPVTGMTIDNAGKLYTCGEDAKLITWSLAKAKQLTTWSVGPEKPWSIALGENTKTMIVASRQIKVYDINTQALLQTFVGHSANVQIMKSFTMNHQDYVMTGSQMDQVICLWKLSKKKSNKTTPTGTFLLDDNAQSLSCAINEQSLTVHLSCITRSGGVLIFLIDLSQKDDRPQKPKLSVKITSEEGRKVKPLPIIAASMQQTQQMEDILLGYGKKQFMIFEQITLDYTNEMQVLVRAEPHIQLKQKSIRHNIDPTEALKTVTPIINTMDVDYKSSISLGKQKNAVDLPMEVRLKNLNLNKEDSVIKPQCKTQLLVQGLHSKDKSLLREVLCTKEIETIELTLDKLPVEYVSPLVNELTILMQSRHINVVFAASWLKVLTQTHSSQLMAMGKDELLNKFGPCIGIIEDRVNCFKELSKLSGRLQLLVTQIKRNKESDDRLDYKNRYELEDQDEFEVADNDSSLLEGDKSDDNEEGKLLQNGNEDYESNDEEDEMDVDDSCNDDDDEGVKDDEDGNFIAI